LTLKIVPRTLNSRGRKRGQRFGGGKLAVVGEQVKNTTGGVVNQQETVFECKDRRLRVIPTDQDRTKGFLRGTVRVSSKKKKPRNIIRPRLEGESLANMENSRRGKEKWEVAGISYKHIEDQSMETKVWHLSSIIA